MLLTFLKKPVKGPHINNVIWLLTVNDVFTWGVYNVTLVLVGLYLAMKLDTNVTEIVGIGTAALFFSRGLLQVPIGILADRLRTQKDEIIFLMIGNLLMGLAVISYSLVTEPWHYYACQVVFGVGAAFNIVDWRKLFAQNLDKGSEGLEYSVYDTVMSFAIAVLAVMGGTVASISRTYFDMVMICVGLIMIVSNIWVILIYYMKVDLPKKKSTK